MEEQRNTDTVKQLYAAFGAGDVQAILHLLSSDCIFRYPGSAPWAGHHRGHEEVREFFRALSESAEIEQFDPAQFVAQGNVVVVTGKERLRTRNLSRMITFDWAHVFTFRDERIILVEFYVDTAAQASGFEASPAERAAQSGPLGVTEPPFGITEPAPPKDAETR